jgi:uncharacterized protein YjiS (DUF1127 family)
MSAQFAKDQMSFAAPATMTIRARSTFVPETEGGIVAAVRGAAAWLGAALKRRAVIGELSMMSDHELADIGISRADIPNVFDRAYVENRMTPRG